MEHSLNLAAKNGNIDKIKSLLKKGANINAKNKRGWSSLMFASKYSNDTSSDDMVRFLLDNGADVNAKNKNEETSLMISSTYSNSTSSLDTVKLLLDNGADINANYGWSSLMIASKYSGSTSSLDTVSLLLDKGADVNAKNKHDKRTSLMIASANSNSTSSLATVELLLDRGADVNAKDDLELSSLMYASSESNSTSSLDTVRLLLERGANINAKTNSGLTSLSIASEFSNTNSSDDTVELLLNRGADPFVNDEGKYPIDLCKTESCKKIISTSMWNIMNNSIQKLSEYYSDETPINKDIWELILLRNKQRQLCKNLNKEENKYVLQGFATMLNIPIAENMTKRQLCNLVSKQLSQGRKLKTNKENFPDIIKLAKTLGINTDQPIDKILDDISSIV